MISLHYFFFFFLNDPAPTDIYTFPLHDALPISRVRPRRYRGFRSPAARRAALGDLRSILEGSHEGMVDQDRIVRRVRLRDADRKSTRLNSSHGYISYAVFCLKKKNN